MRWVPVSLLLERARLFKGLRSRSGRREVLGFGGTRRDIIGFEKKGERKVVPKRKRPKKKLGDIIARTPLKRR
jgi:hypothetical protein